MKLDSVLEFLEKKEIPYSFVGEREQKIEGYSSLHNYKKNTITWIKNGQAGKSGLLVKAAVIECLDGIEEKKLGAENAIFCENSKYVFFLILEHFFGKRVVEKLGQYNIISPDANISDNVIIGNHCTIEQGVSIGAGTIICNNVVVRRNTKIGCNCIIKSGAVIGEIGFGLVKDAHGVYVHVSHFGGVDIGDNVAIGANVTIEQGTIDDTVIESGVKIDDLCQISHNSKIGRNTLIVAGSYIYGSVSIGENGYIATSVIKNQVKIGANVHVGMGSVVTKDITDNKVVYGSPARVIRENIL